MDPPVSAEPESLARRLANRVLQVAHSVDGDARVTSVARWDASDATLVRVTTKSLGNTGTALISALKSACPLASVSLVENFCDGTTEAQLLLPSEEEQRVAASGIAWGSRAVRVLDKVLGLSVFVAVLSVCVVILT